MSYLRYIAIICMLFALQAEVKAQDDSLYLLRSDVHIGLNYSMHTDAYRRLNADNNAFGIRLSYGYLIFRDLPLMIGADVSYAFVNSRKSEYETLDEFGDEFRVRDRWTNHMLSATIRLNYHLFTYGKWSPFIETGVGATYVSTLSHWTDLDDNRYFEPVTVEDDHTWLIKFAGGLEYDIDGYTAAYFRIERSWSGSLEYMALRDETSDSPFTDRHYDFLESSIDLLTFEIGIIARF